MEDIQRIYLDNAAATPVSEEVLTAMQPFWRTCMGNGESIHQEGMCAKRAIEDARMTVAEAIHARPDEVIFTSGGTESNNIALFGAVRAYRAQYADKTPHVIVGATEHPSIRACAEAFIQEGVQVDIVPVDTDGRIDVHNLSQTIRDNTVAVSVSYANSETGVVEHVQDIAKCIRVQKNKDGYPLLHTDASQAFPWCVCDVHSLGVDLMTIDGQKAHAPKGVGALFVRNGTRIYPLFFGGGQERGVRPGTVAVPLVVGLARAVEEVSKHRDMYKSHVTTLVHHFVQRITNTIHSVPIVWNSSHNEAEPTGIVNVSFVGLDAEQMVIELDARGVAVSTQSACRLKEGEGSYVLRAMGRDDAVIKSAVRFSLSRYTTKEMLDEAVRRLAETVEKMHNETLAHK